VTSHNTAFATLGSVQVAPAGNQDIAGIPAMFLRWNRVDVGGAFLAWSWNLAPPWDFNPNFYRLLPGGRLHFDAGQYGFTVPNVAPDVAVVDDIDKQPRPSGLGPHTDRGVDQIEKDATSDVVDRPGEPAMLLASVSRNPAERFVLDYRSAAPGTLTLEVFDVAGRRLDRQVREVAAGNGRFESVLHMQGVVIYRLRLEHEAGGVSVAAGKMTLVR
jgi:hypothetical protein